MNPFKFFRGRDLEKRVKTLEEVASIMIESVQLIVKMEKDRGRDVEGVKDLTGRLTDLMDKTPQYGGINPEFPGEPYHR